MACDFATLDQIDTSDPEQAAALMQQCTEVLLSPDLWLWAIGLTVVGAIVGALIGRRKNAVVRDTLLGAALGPIGWIISAFLPVKPKMKNCPACRAPIGPGDAYCKSCGRKIA